MRPSRCPASGRRYTASMADWVREVTSSGWEIFTTWLESTSTVVAPIRWACELTVCRLVVEPETLQRRLRHREAGSSVDVLVTERLETTIDQLDLAGFTVQKGGRESITELAIDVVNRLGWPVTPVAAS
jgi:hypothetical protein